MRRRLKLIVPILIVVLTVGGLIVRSRMRRDAGGPRTVEVRQGDVVLSVKETGTIEAKQQVEVKSQAAGQILRLLVDESQPVKKGDLIAELDPTEIQREVERTEAQITGARAALDQAIASGGSTEKQVEASIRGAREAVEQARSRLAQARERASSQSVVSRTQVEQAEAALRSAEESLSLEQEATQRQRLAEAQSAFDQAQANLTNAETEAQRAQELQAEGFMSASQVDERRRQVEVARAQFNSAKERLDTVEKETQSRQRALSASVDEAKAALRAAQARESETAISREEATGAEAALRQAQAAYEEGLAGQARVVVAAREVDKAQANLQQLQSAMEQARVRLGYTTVRAPITGIVVKRHVEPGELIMSGVASFAAGTPIVTIADLSEMKVKVRLNEVDAAEVKAGQRAEVRTDALKGRVFPARVSAVSPMAERKQEPGDVAAVPKFEVEVTLAKVGSELRPGLSADVDIIVAERRNVLYLPPEAISEKGGVSTVSVLGAEGQKQKKTVKVGLKTVDRAEIISGLAKGERVLVPKGALMGRKQIPIERAMRHGGD